MNLNYKTSKDYALLKNLLDDGKHVICIRPWIIDGESFDFLVGFVWKDGDYYECREVNVFIPIEESDFIYHMERIKVEFIEPTL